jgi:peroxiredoxin
VLTINLDDTAAARALFDQAHYTMGLLADDGQASKRYNVDAIPHTVLIDRAGRVVSEHRFDLDEQVARLRQ